MSTATGVKVTKAAATERAKRHLRYGYYALPEGAAVRFQARFQGGCQGACAPARWQCPVRHLSLRQIYRTSTVRAADACLCGNLTDFL